MVTVKNVRVIELIQALSSCGLRTGLADLVLDEVGGIIVVPVYIRENDPPIDGSPAIINILDSDVNPDDVI